MATAIKVEDLSKAYQLGQFSTGTLSQDFQRWWALARGKEDPFLSIGETNDRSKKGSSDIVWSLKDINFEVNQGDAVGIIGRNGAGKSTLLKILSQVTTPTKGRVKVKGRVASLLEVGTGFHPELTGRENIFLNGAILGMRKKEIARKFDEIVDFAAVERYIDTPVKRYSSGMYVRLAFAVAAHLENEVLIVDEVLAVGDAEFQKKCLGKMGDITNGQGRTILFVSHNLPMVKELCNLGIYLDQGLIKQAGAIGDVLQAYSANHKAKGTKEFERIIVPNLGLKVVGLSINSVDKETILPGKPLQVIIEMELEEQIDKIGIELIITSEETSDILFATNTKTRKNIDLKLKKGKNKVACVIGRLNLCSGKYYLGLGFDLPLVTFYYYEKEVLSFEIDEAVIKPSLLPTLSAYGRVYLDHEWLVD